jgi:hypothetical protein
MMNRVGLNQAWPSSVIWRRFISGTFICALLGFGIGFSSPVSAAQTVPYKVNFQGRVTDSSGAALPDGLYNMKFRIWTAASGGTNSWSETREAANRVQVTNGLFSVQLGDVTALSVGVFTAQPKYFEVELPTPATATCSTAACASWTEGAMTPRRPLGSSPYAINADTVDGIDGASLARNNAANTFSAAQTVRVNSATAFQVQNTGNTPLLVADTSSTVVKIGNPGSATLANVRLLTTDAEFTGTIRIGSTTNGVDVSAANGVQLYGTARRTNSIVMAAEYAGGVLDSGTGTNHTGTMTAGFDQTARMNYYKWTTTETTAQSYDIVVQVPLPSNFSSWASTPATIQLWTSDTANSGVYLQVLDSNGTAEPSIDFIPITPGTANTWTALDASIAAFRGTYTPGDYSTIRLRVSSANNSEVRLGNLKLNYLSKW